MYRILLKNAHGSRLVASKFDKERRQSIFKNSSKLVTNVNQIAKYCNQHENLDHLNHDALGRSINVVCDLIEKLLTVIIPYFHFYFFDI